MATRTITKTRTKVRVKSEDDQQSTSVSSELPAETSAQAAKRAALAGLEDAQTSRSGSPHVKTFTSDDDDFVADVKADIERDLVLREEKRANGGKLKRKKPVETEADKQTAHTRKLLREGQARERKTAKWAIRERRCNPLVKLLNIGLTITVSDSGSSSEPEDSNESETTQAFRKASYRIRKKEMDLRYRQGKKQGKDLSKSSPDKQPDKKQPPSRVKKESSSPRSLTMKQESDSSATEGSGPEDMGTSYNGRGKGSKNGVGSLPPRSRETVDSSEGDSSEDVNPFANSAAYRDQQTRRANRRDPRGRDASRNERVSQVKVEVKHEEVESTIPSIQQDSTDPDEAPDYAMTDPRYTEWLQRRKQRMQPAPAAAKPDHNQAGGFKPSQQRDARPHFEVKSAEQANVGPLLLGHDHSGKAIEIPAAINRFLRDYQREGVNFFWEHYDKGEGGLLGDDMGLGKTIQVISFLSAIMGHRCTSSEHARRREHVQVRENALNFQKASDLGPTALILAPASVLDNWAREIETWTYLSAAVYRPADKTAPVLKDFRNGKLDIVICGIDTARNHIERLMNLDFSCIFVDEVHRVKNPNSRTSQALQEFQCKRRFGLTGTAMQNRYSELHTILDWCFPGRLGDRRQWKDYVESPLKEAQRKDATQDQLAVGRARALALVHVLLPHFFLRRTKELIADQLPKKTDRIAFCPLSIDQKQAYKRLLSHSEVQIILTHKEPCPCGATDGHGLPYARGKCCNREWPSLVLKWITILTKVANHAVLIYPNRRDKADDPDKYQQDQELVRWAFQDTFRNRTGEVYATEQGDMDAALCGKWPVLRDLLKRWKENGDKVLLFSRSVRLLDALTYWIEKNSYNMLRLDGQTPAEKRLGLCDQFNDPDGGQFLFLISTLAGGVGLNLTAANRVVIFDPNWNPVSDLQAMDRSYRWGQTRDVTVYRLVGAGSIEELIYTRQIYKQHQAEIAYSAANPSRMFVGVQDDSRNQGELFGVQNLFRFTEAANRTKHSIEQAHISELGFELMNYVAKTKKRKRGAEEEGSEAEGDEQAGDQAALNALMGNTSIDDENEDEDDVAKILRDNGVTYTHDHSDLIKNSSVEAKISKAAIKGFQDEKRRGLASNQRASSAKGPQEVKAVASWAPSKGRAARKNSEVQPDINPFEMLFDGGRVRAEELEELADALDFKSAADMARKFALMDDERQSDLIARAKDIVQRI